MRVKMKLKINNYKEKNKAKKLSREPAILTCHDVGYTDAQYKAAVV